MLSTVILWGYIFFLALIFGFASIHLVSLKDAPPAVRDRPVTIIVLIGLAVLASIAGILSLVMNLGLAASLLILLAAAALGFWQRREIWQFLKGKAQSVSRLHWLTILAFLAVFLVILLKSTQAPQNYDTGLYHAQAIRWMETYRAIPGLGNLSDRLVFNSNGLLLSALFSFSFTGLRSFHVLNALLAILLCGYALGKFDRLIKGEITLSNVTAVFLPFLLRRIFSLELSSPGTDLPAALIIWVILTLSIEKVDDEAVSCFDFNFLTIAVLSIFAVTIKLSTLPILLLPLYFFLRQPRGIWRLSFATSVVIAALLFLPWFWRSTVQSGYLVYPLPQVNIIHPDWQIPVENASGAAAWIRSWAKIATSDREAVEKMPLSAWVPVWFHNLVPLDQQILAIDGLACTLLVILFAFKARRAGLIPTLRSPYLVIYLAILLGIAFWFFQAPAMRFGYSFLAFFPAICFAPFGMAALQRWTAIRHCAAPLILVALVLYQGISVYRLANFKTLKPVLFLPADYPRVPVDVHSVGGLTVYTPQQGDQCWYEPFPCIPAVDSDVNMRGESVLDGFLYMP